MARFYSVQVGTIFLTEDGTNATQNCKLAVSNVEDLLTPIAGSVVIAADGSPVSQLVPWTAGKQFDIRVENLNSDVWDDLVILLLDALGDDSSFNVTGTGDTGDFTVSVKPFPQKPFSAERFRNGRITGAVFRFITV